MQSHHHSACKRQQKDKFDVTSSHRQYPNVPATSCRGIDACFEGDIGYVVIDLPLLHRHVATRGRGCRPQRFDIQQNKSTCGCNTLASTASPNAPISLPLARGHLLLDGQCLKRAHGWGGGLWRHATTGNATTSRRTRGKWEERRQWTRGDGASIG